MPRRRATANRQRQARRRVVNYRRGIGSRRRAIYRGRKQRFLFRNPLIRDKCRTVLHYNQNIPLDPKPEVLGPAGSNIYVFSANACYDPDISGVGHQPMYFDNFSEVYGVYRVLYSKITITVLNTNVNTATMSGASIYTQPNYCYKLFCFTDNSNTDFPGYMNAYLEEGGKNCKWRFVGPSLTGKMPKLKHSCTPYKIVQRNKYDDTLAASVGSNPSSPVYYVIGITSADGVTDPPSVTVNVRISYYVEFSNRKMNQNEN